MKRSGFSPRHTPLRATAPAKAEVKLLKPKKCKVCGDSFRPFKAMQTWCAPECGVKLAAKLVAKKEAKAQADDKRKTRAQLEALKTVPQLKKEAQREFNRFIRARDRRAGYACVCCGRPLEWGVAGGAVDAGHYRSVGSADHLRFDEDNCHAQRADCNRYGAGRAVDYRIGLMQRIGWLRVDALESYQPGEGKWTREGLRAIRNEYRRKARELEGQQ